MQGSEKRITAHNARRNFTIVFPKLETDILACPYRGDHAKTQHKRAKIDAKIEIALNSRKKGKRDQQHPHLN